MGYMLVTRNEVNSYKIYRHISSSYPHSYRCYLWHHAFLFTIFMYWSNEILSSWNKVSYSRLKIWYLNRISLKFRILSWSVNMRNAYNDWTQFIILFIFSHHGKLDRQACVYFSTFESKYPDCCNAGVAIHYMKHSFLCKKLLRNR
jgi:hypothetical protein